MTLRTLACLTALFLASMGAQQQESIPTGPKYKTCGAINGRSWNESTRQARFGYIVGFNEAKPELSEGARMTYGELEGALLDFFKDPLNANIPAARAMEIVWKKAKGEKTAELELAERKFWSPSG